MEEGRAEADTPDNRTTGHQHPKGMAVHHPKDTEDRPHSQAMEVRHPKVTLRKDTRESSTMFVTPKSKPVK